MYIRVLRYAGSKHVGRQPVKLKEPFHFFSFVYGICIFSLHIYFLQSALHAIFMFILARKPRQ